MPLPTPILDDRSFDQISQELKRRIPVYTKEWTDHNASDPGITLLELFSYLGESLLFRFNQIPEATYLAFLRLLDIPLRPATCALGLVTAVGTDPAGTLVAEGSEATAGDLSFETREEMVVLPLDAIAMAKIQEDAPAEGSEEEAYALVAQEEYLRRQKAAEGTSDAPAWIYYTAQQVPADPTEPGAQPVDITQTVDGTLWVALLSTDATDETRLADQVLNVAFLLDEDVPSMTDVQACPGAGTQGNSPATVWQISARGDVDSDGDGLNDPDYLTLEVVGDSTAGLTRSGVVRLRLPDDATKWDPLLESDPDAAGAGDLPPVIADDTKAAKTLFWIRGARLGDGPPLGRFAWVGINAARIVQNRLAPLEFVGTGNGQEGQEFTLLNDPVIADSLQIQVQEGGTDGSWVSWTAVSDFAASGPDDRHFTVDLASATVAFGNGLRGRPPQVGERIRAVQYRYGGGAAGNVSAGKVNALTDQSSLKVKNPMATRGGADGEAVADGLQRVPGELRRRDRAVAAGDFRELALETPGLSVGRADVLPLFHPHRPRQDTPGAVSVVVWPASDPKRPQAPMPDRSFLGSVCRFLDARRLVTTELWVIPPTYRKIAVAAGIVVKDGYGVEAVRRWVELILRQYLAPLPPYGPEGEGWPLGRRVYGPELEAAALQVEGVRYMAADLRLARWDDDTRTWVEETGGVDLEAWEVPEVSELTVVAGAPMDPGVALAPDTPGASVALPLPTVETTC